MQAISERLKPNKTSVATHLLRAQEDWTEAAGYEGDAALEQALFRRGG